MEEVRVHLDINFNWNGARTASSEALAATINSALAQLLHKDQIIMSALDNLTAAVAANKSGLASAISLLQVIKASLDAAILAGNQDPAIQALSDQLGAQDADLAAAVVANTPTTTPPTPTPGTSTTVLVSSMNPSPGDVIVTLSATVTGATPTGTVAFLDGTTSLGVAPLVSGVATLDAGFSADTSPHSLTAEYSGDAANAASVSSAVSQVAQ